MLIKLQRKRKYLNARILMIKIKHHHYHILVTLCLDNDQLEVRYMTITNKY